MAVIWYYNLHEYFMSDRLIAGFHEAGTALQRERVGIPVQPRNVPEEGNGDAVPNDALQDQVGQGTRHRIRPDFVIHGQQSSYETLGSIGHVRRGDTLERYLKLSCQKSRYRQPRLSYQDI
jgi:hypothetical protein